MERRCCCLSGEYVQTPLDEAELKVHFPVCLCCESWAYCLNGDGFMAAKTI